MWSLTCPLRPELARRAIRLRRALTGDRQDRGRGPARLLWPSARPLACGQPARSARRRYRGQRLVRPPSSNGLRVRGARLVPHWLGGSQMRPFLVDPGQGDDSRRAGLQWSQRSQVAYGRAQPNPDCASRRNRRVMGITEDGGAVPPNWPMYGGGIRAELSAYAQRTRRWWRSHSGTTASLHRGLASATTALSARLRFGRRARREPRRLVVLQPGSPSGGGLTSLPALVMPRNRSGTWVASISFP